jgi:hypothetical protein
MQHIHTARDIIISRPFLIVSLTRDSVGASSSAVLLFTDAARRLRRLAASRPKYSNRPGVRPAARVRAFCRFVDPLASALHCRITPEWSIAAGRGFAPVASARRAESDGVVGGRPFSQEQETRSYARHSTLGACRITGKHVYRRLENVQQRE